MSEGHESDPECGQRCKMCYALRLNEVARYAHDSGFDAFATTLTLSPFKDADVLNDIGNKAGRRYGVEYISTDFKSMVDTRDLSSCPIVMIYTGRATADANFLSSMKISKQSLRRLRNEHYSIRRYYTH